MKPYPPPPARNAILPALFIVFALLFGLTGLSGCGPGAEQEQVLRLPQTQGKFTLTNAAEHNGKFAVVYGVLPDSSVVYGFGGASSATEVSGVKIENGTAVIPIYRFAGETNARAIQPFAGYAGTDTATLFVLILPAASYTITSTIEPETFRWLEYKNVTFAAGKGAESADTGTKTGDWDTGGEDGGEEDDDNTADPDSHLGNTLVLDNVTIYEPDFVTPSTLNADQFGLSGGAPLDSVYDVHGTPVLNNGTLSLTLGAPKTELLRPLVNETLRENFTVTGNPNFYDFQGLGFSAGDKIYQTTRVNKNFANQSGQFPYKEVRYLYLDSDLAIHGEYTDGSGFRTKYALDAKQGWNVITKTRYLEGSRPVESYTNGVTDDTGWTYAEASTSQPPPAYLGETLVINETLYTGDHITPANLWAADFVLYTQNGLEPLDSAFAVTGTPSLNNGQLSFTLGAPKTELLSPYPTASVRANFTVTGTPNGFLFDGPGFYANGGNLVYYAARSGDYSQPPYKDVFYLYLDADLAIHGEYTDPASGSRETYNIDAKQGWNAITRAHSFEGGRDLYSWTSGAADDTAWTYSVPATPPPPGWLGETLELNHETLYEEDFVTPADFWAHNFAAYVDGSAPLPLDTVFDVHGTPSLENGVFSLTLGAPKTQFLAPYPFDETIRDHFTVTGNPNAYRFDGFGFYPDNEEYVYDAIRTSDYEQSPYKDIYYLYLDADLSIHGEYSDPDTGVRTQYKLNAKQGWNVYTVTFDDQTQTETFTSGEAQGTTWIYLEPELPPATESHLGDTLVIDYEHVYENDLVTRAEFSNPVTLIPFGDEPAIPVTAIFDIWAGDEPLIDYGDIWTYLGAPAPEVRTFFLPETTPASLAVTGNPDAKAYTLDRFGFYLSAAGEPRYATLMRTDKNFAELRTPYKLAQYIYIDSDLSLHGEAVDPGSGDRVIYNLDLLQGWNALTKEVYYEGGTAVQSLSGGVDDPAVKWWYEPGPVPVRPPLSGPNGQLGANLNVHNALIYNYNGLPLLSVNGAVTGTGSGYPFTPINDAVTVQRPGTVNSGRFSITLGEPIATAPISAVFEDLYIKGYSAGNPDAPAYAIRYFDVESGNNGNGRLSYTGGNNDVSHTIYFLYVTEALTLTHSAGGAELHANPGWNTLIETNTYTDAGGSAWTYTIEAPDSSCAWLFEPNS